MHEKKKSQSQYNRVVFLNSDLEQSRHKTSDAGKGHILWVCLDRKVRVTHAENPGDRSCDAVCSSLS